MLPFIEFKLWSNCQLNCLFCDEKYEHQSSIEERLNSIKRIKKDILNLKELHNILFIGGEIFANLNTQLKESLKDLFKTAFESKNINMVYTNTNLVYKLDFLMEILSICDISRLKLATSWDIDGRFHTLAMKKLWEHNIKSIRNKYKNLYLVVNIILNKKLINEIKNNNFKVKNFEKKYSVLVNTIPYVDINGISDYLPTKKEVNDCFIKLYAQDKEWLYYYLTRLLLIYQLTLYDQNGNICTDNIMSCGHHYNFSKCFYNCSDCFKCFCNSFLRKYY